MTPEQEQYADLLTQIKAIELVVRGLFTKWALEADDPRASAFRMIEGMIGSLQVTKDAQDEVGRLYLERVEDHLRTFGEHIQHRLERET